jgi:hypothetical protein
VITNPNFHAAGSGPGFAAAWTLRSSCAREAIAAFAPEDSVESFESWWTWSGILGTASLAPFVPNGTIEDFDAWPSALFALELSPGLVAGTMSDGFDKGWWPGTAAFEWSAVQAVTGLFANGEASETFDDWPVGAPYRFAFPVSSLTAAPFAGGSPEMFTAWTTKNTTLG